MAIKTKIKSEEMPVGFGYKLGIFREAPTKQERAFRGKNIIPIKSQEDLLEIEGITKTIREWLKISGKSYKSYCRSLTQGYSREASLVKRVKVW